MGKPIGVEIRIFISESHRYGKSSKKDFEKLPPASMPEMARKVKGKPCFCSGGNVFVNIFGNFNCSSMNRLAKIRFSGAPEMR